MPYKDPEKRKEYQKKYKRKYRLENKEKIKTAGSTYYEENKEQIKEKQVAYRSENKDKLKVYHQQYREENNVNIKENRDNIRNIALTMITASEMIEPNKWHCFCQRIRCSAKTRNQPYSEDFTNELMLSLMVKGCHYCGDIATTIDRLDSTIAHTPDNCVGCCQGCNISKGAADPDTFVRKSYYRVKRMYYDNIHDIWFEYKTKPSISGYKKKTEEKNVPFELTKEEFCTLIKGDCEYCHRSPTTYFGIDRVKPSDGYINGNVVTCCWDCNLDKHEGDIDMTIERNRRIAGRVDAGELVIGKCVMMTLHTGTRKTSNKVCSYGKVYENKAEASRAIGKNDNYVSHCIQRGIHTDEIFEISYSFYEEYKDRGNINREIYDNFISSDSRV